MEYKILPRVAYEKYLKNAEEILNRVQRYFNVPFSNISYKEIIRYFEDNYNITFHYMDYDFVLDFDSNPDNRRKATQEHIRYPELLQDAHISFVDDVLLSRCSGMTMEFDNKTYFININQYNVPKGRIIFTILHELSHVFCHLEKHHVRNTYLSLYREDGDERYPEELIPFEDEANTVASILFMNDVRLENSLLKGLSFKNIAYANDMTEPALHNRIKNYLMFTKGYPERKALHHLCDYRYRNVPIAISCA